MIAIILNKIHEDKKMKKVILGLICCMTIYATIAEARYTRSYVRSNGTVVQGYWGN
jgi:hypothetical protein